MTRIKGHDAVIERFLAAMSGERPPHAWIFSGNKGLGKASLAKQAALRLLAEAAGPPPGGESLNVNADHPIAALFAARSHPDYRLVEREIWVKPASPERIMPYADRKGDEVPARSIRVSQIRMLDPLFVMSPSLSNRRVIVIDAADEMERNASNALLKRLEEPPPFTTFVLISHAIGALLPTIRSRCRILRFSALDDAAMTSILRDELPELDAPERDALARLSQGSPGRALEMAGVDISGMLAALDRIATSADPDNGERIGLAQSMTAKSATRRFEIFLSLVPPFIARHARDRVLARKKAGEVLAIWEKARDLAGQAIPGSLEPFATTFALGGLVAELAGAARNAKA